MTHEGNISTPLTPEEVAMAESRYEPGRVPGNVWLEHLRLNTTVTAEMAPFRIHGGKIQVYMFKRSSNDPFYPNQLHMPGTMCNGNDKTIEGAYERLVSSEKLNSLTIGERQLVNPPVYKVTPRGNEVAFLLLAEVLDGGNEENWYDVDNLPQNTIHHHVEMISIVSNVVRAKIARENYI